MITKFILEMLLIKEVRDDMLPGEWTRTLTIGTAFLWFLGLIVHFSILTY